VSDAGFPANKRPATASASAQTASASARELAERRAKLRTLRTQIQSMIKTHGGPWHPEEFPHS
jgi:hypothetical protein